MHLIILIVVALFRHRAWLWYALETFGQMQKSESNKRAILFFFPMEFGIPIGELKKRVQILSF